VRDAVFDVLVLVLGLLLVFFPMAVAREGVRQEFCVSWELDR
jgi:hypothetical protein